MARNLAKAREMVNQTEVVWNAAKKEIAGCITDSSVIDPDLIQLLNGCNKTIEAAMDLSLEQAETLDYLTEKMWKFESMLSDMLAAQGRAEKTLDRLTDAVNKK